MCLEESVRCVNAKQNVVKEGITTMIVVGRLLFVNYVRNMLKGEPTDEHKVIDINLSYNFKI